ncbi:MAG TPA: hypothetical protein PLX35_07590 [Cyclobacteriaceae bacterium]|nr:hypothetical protein [Cyclobacteriaceae bacterium]
MKIRFGLLVLLLAFACTDPTLPTIEQTPVVTLFQKVLGGTQTDTGRGIATFADGSQIAAGTTRSVDGNLTSSHGGTDAWLARIDAGGVLVWNKPYGGLGQDEFTALVPITDGGVLAVGSTTSNDGDVTANHGLRDIWVVRLNGSGDIQWQKTLGGSGDEFANAALILSDGSFIIAGYTVSNDGDVSGNHGAEDIWVIKLDGTGKLLWQKTFGGTFRDVANDIALALDGGFAVAGETSSSDGDVGGSRTSKDYLIIRMDANGNKVWSKALGSSTEDVATAVTTASDGTITVAGYASSNDGDVAGSTLTLDNIWVVKVDGVGTMIWQKTFGGSGLDRPTDIITAADGSYLVLGQTTSNDGNVKGNHGQLDAWLIDITGSTGTLIWQQTFGGTANDVFYNFSITSDNGLAMAGSTLSNDGDVTGNHGDMDMWVMKVH